jgi:hypothetical protein
MENDKMENEERYEASLVMEIDGETARDVAFRFGERLMTDPIFYIAVDCGEGGSKLVYEFDKRNGNTKFVRYEDPTDFIR